MKGRLMAKAGARRDSDHPRESVKFRVLKATGGSFRGVIAMSPAHRRNRSWWRSARRALIFQRKGRWCDDRTVSADDIVERLASCDPIATGEVSGDPYCVLCNWIGVSDPVLDDHDSNCPWRLAVERSVNPQRGSA